MQGTKVLLRFFLAFTSLPVCMCVCVYVCMHDETASIPMSVIGLVILVAGVVSTTILSKV